MKTMRMFFGLSLACLLVFVLGSTTSAQTGQQPMMQEPGPGLQISEVELEKVASAYMDVQEIRLDLQESLAGVTDPGTAQMMQEEAGQAMLQAVQDNGLEVEVYNQVMQEVQTNVDLREQLTAKLEALQ